MSKKISGAEHPLAEIFSSYFDYLIPTYQRPYAWTETQTSELFTDLYDFFSTENEDTYFLGSIVLIKEEGKPRAEVIDGQQRLTTLTILLAALTSRVGPALRSDFEGYIREPGRVSQGLKPKPRLTLRERERDFFASYVQGLNLAALEQLDPAQLATEAMRNIRHNALLMNRKLEQSFGADHERLCAFGAFLVQRCFLVAVSTPSQQSAFRVFSVLNSRGLDLLPTDIIKSDVIGQIRDAAHRDEINERWEDLEVDAGREGFAELFGHIRMIFAKTKAKRALLEEFREHVLAGRTSENVVVQTIEPYAEAYLMAKKCAYHSTGDASVVNGYLRWLNRIDNADWLPAAILFLAQKKADPAYVSVFFERFERLVACLHISGYGVNERIERYAPLLAELQASHSLEAPPPSLELSEPEKARMREIMDGKVYADLSARRRNYLILRLDSFLADGAATYDPNVLTIEHVLPQTIDPKYGWDQIWPDPGDRAEWVHRLGNLVPLNFKTNIDARNYSFETKKQAYFTGRRGVSSFALSTQVLNATQWTKEVVARRQASLMRVLEKHWDLAP